MKLAAVGIGLVLWGACGEDAGTTALRVERGTDVTLAHADEIDEPAADTNVDADMIAVDAHTIEVDADTNASDAVADTNEPDAMPDTNAPDVDIDDGPTRYPGGLLHSPLTAAVVRGLAAIAARAPARDDVFMKVGDSITVARSFLTCLADASVDLGDHADLDATRAAFAAADDLVGDDGLTTPFDRASLAAEGGRTADWAVSPSNAAAPLDRERAAITPRFAVVMYGTNDIGYWPDDFSRMFRWYGENMLDLVDRLLASGVIPILSSVPPRLDSPALLDPRVASMNALIWGMADAYQVPFVDFHLALSATGDWGMAGDGVHPRAACDANGKHCGCRFDASGLAAGYNVRNLVTLEALDRVRRVVVVGEPAPDVPTRAPLGGDGTADEPFVIDALPFSHRGDTRAELGDAIDSYPACNAPQNESGPEVYYRLRLDRPTPIGALVVDRAGVDIDVHILAVDDDGATECRARDDTFIEDTLPAGTWLFVLDTFVNAGGTAQAGEYLFVLHQR